jgi:uncharacterized membrane protein
MGSRLAIGLTVVATIWVLLIVAAPVALARGRTPIVTLAAYQIGSLICHQKPERSFHLAGMQMPVCARCFGLYVAGAAGLLFAWISRLRVPSLALSLSKGSVTKILMATAAVPIVLTVALEMIGLITTTNIVRMSTGLPLGFAAGVLIVASLTPANSAMISS